MSSASPATGSGNPQPLRISFGREQNDIITPGSALLPDLRIIDITEAVA